MSWPFVTEDTPFIMADAGVVAGGDGVASLSTLFALLNLSKKLANKKIF